MTKGLRLFYRRVAPDGIRAVLEKVGRVRVKGHEAPILLYKVA
jgi:hypothetical protein